MSAWRTATLAPFRSRIFLAIWSASLVSNFGGLIQAVGASWLMTSLAPSPSWVALVQTATALPILLLSLPAGALADIWDKRRVMLGAQYALFTVSVALAVVAYSGHIAPWSLLMLTFMLGCAAALYGPAWQSSVGEQVPLEHLPAAISLSALAFNLARTVGPALGGLIVATAGPPSAFAVNAATYVGLIVVLSRWRRRVPPDVLPPENMATAMQAGLRYVGLSPAIRTVLLRGLFFGLMASAVWALLPLIARDLLRGGPLMYGALLGAFGIGAAMGALSISFARERLSSEALIVLCSVAFGGATIVMASSPWVVLTLLMMLFTGAAWVMALSTLNITVQISSPRWVVGRALATYQMLTFGGLAGGSWLFGEIAQHYDLRVSLTAAGMGMVLTAALGFVLRLPPSRALNLEPLPRSPVPPNVNADIVPQSGPVVVSVEYRIAPEDRNAFMIAMREMRRIRRRDGARRWHLLQDIDDPTRLTERFQSPTWLDYLRQRQRFTVSDKDVALRVHVFHRGEQPPVVTHMLERTLTPAASHKSQAEWVSERASVTDPHLPPSAMPALDKMK